MRTYIHEQIDALDASVFSGDLLEVKEEREALKAHCERWLRAIADQEAMAEFEDGEEE